jgi:geranylgeranyl diphosphate synthase type II
MGAIAGGAAADELERLTVFADKIGLAFQIEDDILDETSTDEILGKPAGADAAHHKMTYPAVHGMEASIKKVRTLTDEATAALDILSRETTALRAIAEYLVGRKY